MLYRHLIKKLDLTSLHLLVSIHEEGSLTKAAEREMLALSAASKRLQEVEQVLGIALFERTLKGMKPTAAGKPCCSMRGKSSWMWRRSASTLANTWRVFGGMCG
ncbi:helix-turn-helix domain-containing protein [Pseudomonas cremoricolorata]|uniref:helix-turn-helix domain-containing protein n=1 Tax=Pseudomonas cremoricolorata TaxID=157783 RepID=UPI001427EDAE